VPLIVVNCIILGRAEGFAYHNGVPRSVPRRTRHGTRLHVAITILGAMREILGNGTVTS